MKYINIFLIINLFVLSGCRKKQMGNVDFVTVDITKSVSSKKELILQDFMDVEYVVLETKDNYINKGFVQDLGKEIILVTNQNDDGCIFVYDRTGKALRTINRKGQGHEEYTYISYVALDEDKDEIFVNDIFIRKIFVYDLHGNFKRSFKHKKNAEEIGYRDIFNYDKNNLICYDQYNEDMSFVLISKQDGSITKKIEIPFKEKKFLHQTLRNEANNTELMVTPGPCRPISFYNGNCILSELSSDTVYTLLPDYSLLPFIVRVPPIQSMDPNVFLIIRLISDRYYFMETIKNEYNFDTKKGFSKTFFMYDRKDKSFYKYNVYNGDYLSKREIYMTALRPVNNEIESWQRLEAYQLIEANEKAELKGELKKITETLSEESNPVIMLVKHKK